MTPRNPDEITEEEVQDKVLQAIHNALNVDMGDIADPTQQKATALEKEPKKEHDVEVELDRVEAYLKGPTAFTA